jgi:hypothetical protein
VTKQEKQQLKARVNMHQQMEQSENE